MWGRTGSWLGASAMLVVLGCAPREHGTVRFGAQAPAQAIAGLGRCDTNGAKETLLDPSRSVTILVHGCNASGGRFGALAEVFELHDQQTLCFRYDDRERITDAAGELRAALDTVQSHLANPQITVLGHSQGGLVARAALSEQSSSTSLAAPVRLVTVSSPFAGIRAASHCASMLFRVLSFGTSLAVCRTVAGPKWRDIHKNAGLVKHPPPLAPFVSEHIEIITDERESCRHFAVGGGCARRDFVFTVAEQKNPRVESDRRVESELIAAGHTEIVGTESVQPEKLVRVLQQTGVLLPTPPDKRVALQALLSRLF